MKTSELANPTRDLSQTEAWFRDSLLKLLRWSGAIIIVLTGWTLGNDKEEFSLHQCSLSWTDHSCQRALALALGYPALLFGWILVVRWARERCPEHSTVPSKRAIYTYVIAVIAFSLIVLLFLLDD